MPVETEKKFLRSPYLKQADNFSKKGPRKVSPKQKERVHFFADEGSTNSMCTVPLNLGDYEFLIQTYDFSEVMLL